MPTTTAKKMWRKRFLVPLWVVELIVTGIFFILGCVVLSYADHPNIEDTPYYSHVVTAAGAVIISLAGVTILLTLIEIGLFAASKLTATLHLISAVVKALIWLIYFVLLIVGSVTSRSGSALDIVLSLAVLVCTIAQVIYGSIIVHRVRKSVYNNHSYTIDDPNAYENNHGGNHGPVTYASAENGIKMGSAPVPTYR